MKLSENETEVHLFGAIIVSHYSLKKDIEPFGHKATNATSAALEKIHHMGTYDPMNSTKLTRPTKTVGSSFTVERDRKKGWPYQSKEMRDWKQAAYFWQLQQIRW